MDDIVFTFDTKPFKKAMTDVAHGFVRVKKSADEFTKVTVQNFGSGVNKLFTALSRKLVALGAAFLSVRAMFRYIPELGRAFRHAGEIALRTFFWPLRKLLIPVLNDLLLWTRDHRAMFLRWGVAVANAFKLVSSVISGLIDLAKTFTQSFFSRFREIFGDTVRNVSEISNLVMFRLVMIAEFVKALLTPLFSFVGEKFGEAIANIAAFGDELVKSFRFSLENYDMFQDLADIFSQLANALSLSTTEAKGLNDAFRDLGGLVGKGAASVLIGIIQILDMAISTITTMVSTLKIGKAMLFDDPEDVTREKMELFKSWEEIHKRTTKRSRVLGNIFRRLFGMEELPMPTFEEKEPPFEKELEFLKKGKPFPEYTPEIQLYEQPTLQMLEKGLPLPMKKLGETGTIRIEDINIHITTTEEAKEMGEEFAMAFRNRLLIDAQGAA